MTATASLPMYNPPEMWAANTRFWEALRGLLREAGLEDEGSVDCQLQTLFSKAQPLRPQYADPELLKLQAAEG